MNRQMPSKGRDPRKHNLSIRMANEIRKDVKEALEQPHLHHITRTILKSYDKKYRQAPNKKNFNGWVLAG